jgi:UDP-glucose 4-epimerase
VAAGVLRRAGLRIPQEMLRQLRYGRGLDNRSLKAAGLRFRYTTRETVLELAKWLRTAPLRDGEGSGYRYEREVEEFLRYSPSVRQPAARRPVNVAPRDRP